MCQWLMIFLRDQTVLNALGAAAGGFLGVILFFFVRLIAEKIRARPILLRRYSCAHDQNIGDAEEYEGQLMHHHGQRVTDGTELRRIGRASPVWEWNRKPCGRGEGASLMYGPYTTDFSEPGQYEVSFATRAFGISKRSELNHDPILLEFDIARTTTQYAPTPTGIAKFDSIVIVSKHFVRASDLAGGGWINIPLRFYATGEGVWEYRIHAYDGVSQPHDHIGQFGQNIRLFFDSVTIKQVRKMHLPWG